MNSHGRTLFGSALLALGLATLPQTADAHGQYLQGISNTVGSELGTPACALPGQTCGLCHEPNQGDRLENVAVGGTGSNSQVRNGPFYDSLTASGWNHAPHAADMNVHRDNNLALLLDPVLVTMLDDEVDSDMDGVADLVELQRGYNPLLAYDPNDPTLSQLCDTADPFDGSSGDGDGDPTTGDGDGDATTGDGDPTGSTSTDMDTDTGTDTDGMTETGTDEAGNDDAGGCRSTGGDEGPVALLGLFALGLGLRSRRRTPGRE